MITSKTSVPWMKMRGRVVLFALLLLAYSSVAGSDALPEILINRKLAERISAAPGDIVQVSGSGEMRSPKEFRVTHVFDEKADPYKVPLRPSLLKMHLTDLQMMLNKEDQVDLISIRVKPKANAKTLAERLNSESIGFTAYSAQELAIRSSSTFQVVSRFHQAIALITMTAGAIFIFALVVMRVEDQRKNLAILTVTGISKSTILKSLIVESTFFAFFASLLGAGIGMVAAQFVNLYYQHYYQTTLTFAHVTSSILLRAIVLSFALGLFAGTISWFRLRHVLVLEELGR